MKTKAKTNEERINRGGLILVICYLVLILVFLFGSACTKDRVAPVQVVLTSCDSLNVTYSKVIKPIIMNNCSTTGCHISGTSVPGDYTTYAGLKIHVDNGKFKFRAVDIRDMPTVGPLNESDIQKINCWLDNGAPNN